MLEIDDTESKAEAENTHDTHELRTPKAKTHACFLTRALVKRTAKTDNLSAVVRLDLHAQSKVDKISVIENLDGLFNLQGVLLCCLFVVFVACL